MSENQSGDYEHKKYVLSTVKTLDGPSKGIRSLLYFGKPYYIIISGSFDGEIWIWDSINFNLKKVIKEFRQYVFQLIQLEEDSFLAAGDSVVKCFSVDHPFELKKSFRYRSTVLRMMRITDDLFLCWNVAGDLSVMCCSTNKVIRKIRNEPNSKTLGLSRLIPSRTHSRCFYANTDDEKKSVKLINIDTSQVMRSFYRHKNRRIYTISIFLNTKSEEILVCGGNERILYFYNTTIDHERTNPIIRKIKLGYVIGSSFSYNDKFLWIGDAKGIFRSIRIDTDPLPKSNDVESRLFTQGIRDFLVLRDHRNQSLLKFAACSDEKLIRICEISTLCDNPFKLYTLEEIEEIIKIQNDYIRKITERDLRFFFEKERVQNELIRYQKDLEETILNEISKVSDPSSFQSEQERESTNRFHRRLIRYTKSWMTNFLILSNDVCYLGETKIIKMRKNEEIGIFKNYNHRIGQSDYIIVPDGYGIEFKKIVYLLSFKVHYTPQYIGNFMNGLRHGKGRIFEPKLLKHYEERYQVIFEGSFSNGKKDGKGKEFEYIYSPYSSNNNSSSSEGTGGRPRKVLAWDGQFRDGLRDGRGEAYDSSQGRMIRGDWKKGELLKDSIYSYDCQIIDFGEIQSHLTDVSICGKGSYGIVYKINSSHLSFLNNNKKKKKKQKNHQQQKFVAIKVMKVDNLYERDLLFRMMKRGVELSSQLLIKKNDNNNNNNNNDHRHILKIYGIFRSHNQTGCCMEYCKLSVDKIIETSQNSISLEEKIRFLYETSEGMKSLHSKNIMHRDLKWSNILLSRDNIIKITDFDTLREDERAWRVNTSTLTSRIGTPAFLSPEAFLKQKYGMEVDVYSFGLMIYALLYEMNNPFITQKKCENCGMDSKKIFETNTLNHHISNCGFRPKLDPFEMRKHPKFLTDLMIKCWSHDPKRRPTFDQILRIFDDQKQNRFLIIHFSFIYQKNNNNNNEKKKKNSFSRKKRKRKEKMLLIDPKVLLIRRYLKNLFDGEYKLEKIRHHLFGEICSNEDLIDVIRTQSKPLNIEIELSENKNKNISHSYDHKKDDDDDEEEEEEKKNRLNETFDTIDNVNHHDNISQKDLLILRLEEENRRLRQENSELKWKNSELLLSNEFHQKKNLNLSNNKFEEESEESDSFSNFFLSSLEKRLKKRRNKKNKEQEEEKKQQTDINNDMNNDFEKMIEKQKEEIQLLEWKNWDMECEKEMLKKEIEKMNEKFRKLNQLLKRRNINNHNQEDNNNEKEEEEEEEIEGEDDD